MRCGATPKGEGQPRTVNTGTKELSWYHPTSHSAFSWNREAFRSCSVSGQCQIILKKGMRRTKKPDQEKIKVKIKTSDQAKPLNITFPLTSMQIILRYIFLILFILFKRERPHQGEQGRVVRMHNLMTVCGSHYRRRQESCQSVRRGPWLISTQSPRIFSKHGQLSLQWK